MRRIFILIIIISTSLGGFAQRSKKQRQAEKRAHINNLIKQEEEGVITYKKSFVFGAKLINDGYGVFFELGRASSIKKSLLYQLEISERKHIKEDKQSNPYINSIPFIYGKENFVYPVKLGVQQQILLGNKSNKNGVSVTANYGGGISLSLLRPYYLEVQKGTDLMYVKYNSPDSALFLRGAIYGGPTFGKGWSDLKVTPGLYAKTSLRFDYGSYNEIVSAIEVGISGEYYTSKIPILIRVPQRRFFFSGFVAILFGKRK
ncbi:MAG: hypothetical protein M3Z92_03405 [Bacteroidota bacterium]|nr:hypothetical protein [Bacteroidota bacterium]